MQQKLSGVLPVVPTPFFEDGAVDIESLRNLVNFSVDAGVGALVYPGVASEDVQLSSEERKACLSAVVDQNAGRVPVIGGVNATTAEGMVQMAEQVADLGADMIMAMAIPDMGGDWSKWFHRISDATEGLPIVLQNLFAPRGADLSAEEMIALANAVPAVRFVKEECIPSGERVSELVAAVGADLDAVIGGGGARYLFEELERGAVATMPAIELLETHVQLMNAYAAGRRAEALELYTRSLPLLLIQAPYRMRMTKLILKHRGMIKSDFTREPLPALDAKLQALVLEQYALLNQSLEMSCAS
ncbi:dihydrodipicolinate synthase family protein [Halocynthiibacter sp. C4]|uniref:dihydrodipicolinate synthase family protein n=1 Tax=Halocynthiibacter sp. C4 TaxID=2992758 RepID=UPI00237A6C6C|nr:dihydrodipicolinate synthase family protein [Halocynthiibacter sp. C4]MDE0591572.1 dihydrodipicolinate synthase family protein [Halocynthiibacter sp. C4]